MAFIVKFMAAENTALSFVFSPTDDKDFHPDTKTIRPDILD